VVEDFRLACTSRALDDREILLQKQSRVFFQISGAGHEVLLTALARSLRPGSDWFFPYYRDRALALALGVTPRAMLAQAVGAADDPASAGRQMPCHFSDADVHIVTQSSPTGSQCLPAVGCAEAGRYIVRRPELAALGCRAAGDEVVYVSLGEGATSEGEFWESLNTACRLHLPVLFVVADNGYAISVRAADQAPAPVPELVRGFRGLAVASVDGWDYAACRSVGARAVARVRAGEGPGLLHARVTRPYSHSSADAQTKYRAAAELADEATHDPIDVLQRQLVAAGILGADAAQAIRRQAAEEVARAADEALAAPRPDPAHVRWHLTATATPASAIPPHHATTDIPLTTAITDGGTEASAATQDAPLLAGATTAGDTRPSTAPTMGTSAVVEHPTASAVVEHPTASAVVEHPTASAVVEQPTASAVVEQPTASAGAAPAAEPAAASAPLVLAEALRATLHELMAADERVRVFGEDVADAPDEVLGVVEGKGGVFGVTRGLQRRFGSARCYNTPLAEANIVGRGVGQALRGLRPIAEVQFFDYIWPAMQQLRSEAATIRWRSAGAFRCPLVVRVAIGGYLTGGAIWHSQCGESIFAHIPGLQVAFPSRAADAVRLLRTAVACEDPVLFLEHKHLYRQRDAADPMPAPDDRLPFGHGAIVRPGRHLTIVTWGATVALALAAAELLAVDGADVEVIDLRTIVPWDHDLVAASVTRTGRLLVVHEDVLTAGFGAEVAAWVAEHCFWSLDAPVHRVAAPDVWVPYAPELERAVLPQVDDVVDGARAVLDC
jgi:pyruvate/2-oxoglutarate/acetoin dehydrogenase E1 component/TPP-dependent pyruvate/acetoin dehydrogenase alpha subunit